jgi:hypothetical protein
MKSKIILVVLMIISITFLYFEGSDFNDVQNNSDLSGLVISEIIPDNSSLMVDDFGNFFDIIEIYNAGNNKIRLNNYGLTDEPDVLHQWEFPDVSIESGEYLLVYAAGKRSDELSEISDCLYSNFKMDKNGGKLLLSDDKGKVLSSLVYQEIKADMSYGVSENGYDYYLRGTPLLSNNGILCKEFR